MFRDLEKRSHIIHLIDFGLAKKYRDTRTNQHIPYCENKQLTGTARYASISTHLGFEQSRRDDLESIGYMLIYFIQGILPWQGLKAETKQQKYVKIAEAKINTPPGELTKGIPIEFRLYLEYCRSLPFPQKPDYTYLRSLFRQLFMQNNFMFDFAWDWSFDHSSLYDNSTIQQPQQILQNPRHQSTFVKRSATSGQDQPKKQTTTNTTPSNSDGFSTEQVEGIARALAEVYYEAETEKKNNTNNNVIILSDKDNELNNHSKTNMNNEFDS